MPSLVDAEGNDLLKKPDFSVPHIMTFSSLYQGGFSTYFQEHWDEALRHRRVNALAMRRDCWLMALMRERKDGALRLKWSLVPDNDKDPSEKAAADAMTKAIHNYRRLNRIRRACLESIWYGRYGAQLRWGWQTMNLPGPVRNGPPESGQPPEVKLVPTRTFTVLDHRPLNGDKIAWTFDGTPAVMVGMGEQDRWGKGLKTITTNIAPAVVLDRPDLRRRFLIHTHDPDDADYFEGEQAAAIFGVGVRSRIYWLNWMREEYLSWVCDTLERIGLGIIVVKYELGNAEAKKLAEATAKTLSRRTPVLVPVAADQLRTGSQCGVEVIETPTAGIQMVMAMKQDVEEKIERYVVGQSMSSGGGGKGGLEGDGRAQFAKDTKQDVIASDAEELDETLTGSYDDREPGLVDQAFRWTFPDLYGNFRLRWKSSVDEIDPLKMEMVTAAAGLGVEFGEEDVRSLTGMPEPRQGAKVVGGQQQQLGPDGQPMPGMPPDDTGDLNGEEQGGMGPEPEMPERNGRVSVSMNGKGIG